MNPETLEALKGSIEKWRKIVEEDAEDDGAHDCPLCELYHPEFRYDDDAGCRGCPINTATKKDLCRGTPYVDFVQECDEFDRATSPEALSAARAMLAFLRSLLPEEEKAE